MAGLQGAGQDDNCRQAGETALRETQKKKVLVVSCDVYRPAAIEQLKTVTGGRRRFLPSSTSENRRYRTRCDRLGQGHYHDVPLVDTAGRLAIDEAMMGDRRPACGVKPVETLFVVDAMLGQDAVNTGEVLQRCLPLTGIILTKLDGDARGGAAPSVRCVTGNRSSFAGVGEKLPGWSLSTRSGWRPRFSAWATCCR